jgi:hypothetical protein
LQPNILTDLAIIFFCLIPVGIVILLYSIKLVRKSFSGDIILEISFTQKSADFVITKPGNYSIWHKGQFFRKAPLNQFKPVIINKSTGDKIWLSPSIFRPNSNNGVTARMELFRFILPAGKYRLELDEGSSISGFENSIIRYFPVRQADLDKYFIQVRESQPSIFVIFGIILISLAGLCIIGGLIFGILADQIFNNNG